MPLHDLRFGPFKELLLFIIDIGEFGTLGGETRSFGYSGESVANALGITRSGVCRGAMRGKEIAEKGSALWVQIERLVNKSTTPP